MKPNKLSIILLFISIILFIFTLYTGNRCFTNLNNSQNSHKIVDNAIFHHDELLNNYINLKEVLENGNE